ncbi:CTB family bacteriocin [Pseudanabaenaceae cyanobacterium LEGE 13415]|nr:CTB family bacteriocin [Pseudanabaenaceae cyanobacterium LEGE 13415]
MSEINKPMELSSEELDAIAGGSGVELEKDLDQSFVQNIQLDRRRNAIGANGAISEEETAQKQTEVTLNNDLFAREFPNNVT